MTAGYYILVENEEERGRCWEVVVAWLSWLMKSWKRAKLRSQEPDQQDFTGCDQTLSLISTESLSEHGEIRLVPLHHAASLSYTHIHTHIHVHVLHIWLNILSIFTST